MSTFSRQAWADLGDLSKDEAIIKFVTLLNEVCPMFKTFMEAHKREQEERERRERELAEQTRIEAEAKAAEELHLAEEAARAEAEVRQRDEQQKLVTMS